jgi:hypothetical protein
MKKSALLGIVSVAMLTCLIYAASAQLVPSGYQIEQSFRQVIDIVSGALTPVFEVLLNTQNNEYFFAKVLLLLLLFIIVYFVLGRSKAFGLNKGALFVVSAIVALLSIRYLPENDLITGILLPYGTMGVAITTFLPFLIYLFFVHESLPGTKVRQAAWIVYGVAFLALTMLRWGDVSVTSFWLYVSGLILVILAVIFDPTIHGYFGMFETSKFIQGANQRVIAGLQEEYVKLGPINTKAANARKATIVDQLYRYHAEVPSM